jgi:hypothetical protein
MSNSRNQNTRLELLIVLDYLLNHTNAKHIPQQKDYIEYAKQTYKYDFKKPQHIREILDFVYKLKQKFPKLLPFEMEDHNTGKRNKYFITNKGLTETEIKALLSSLQHNIYAPNKIVDPIIEKLLPLVTNQHDIPDYQFWRSKINKKVQKIPLTIIEKMIELDNARQKLSLVELVFNDNLVMSLYFKDKPIMKLNQNVKGHVYRLYDQGNQPYVLLINQATQKLESYMIANLKQVIRLDMEDRIEKLPTPEERFNDPDFQDPEINLSAAVNPLPEGEIATILFRFIHSDYNFGFISNSFLQYFKSPMKFKDEMESIKQFQTNQPETSQSNQTIKVTYVRLKVNTLTYIKWATSYEVARLIETRTPRSVIEDIYNHFAYLAKLNQINHE